VFDSFEATHCVGHHCQYLLTRHRKSILFTANVFFSTKAPIIYSKLLLNIFEGGRKDRLRRRFIQQIIVGQKRTCQ
jgi:hypothetical protein